MSHSLLQIAGFTRSCMAIKLVGKKCENMHVCSCCIAFLVDLGTAQPAAQKPEIILLSLEFTKTQQIVAY